MGLIKAPAGDDPDADITFVSFCRWQLLTSCADIVTTKGVKDEVIEVHLLPVAQFQHTGQAEAATVLSQNGDHKADAQ